MKKSIAIITGLLSGVFALSLFGCDGNGNGNNASDWRDKDIWLSTEDSVPTEAAVIPTEADFGFNAAVHDPSVFRDPKSGTYYAFGSHFAAASSTDLVKWTQELNDGDSYLLYQKEWREVLKQSDEYVPYLAGDSKAVNSTWAPDVEYINGKYYMYYSLTEKFGSGKSVIGRVSSKNILGPYSKEEIIIKSDGSGGQPNCIDPELFYDKNGKLWMVYGSFYGGIYILELDKDGLPVPDQDFGTRIWMSGGAVEGPFVFYNATLDYYYLMVSEGDLNTDYNMRVARSKNPNGPYEDITGRDVGQRAGGGNKLAGNYSFSGGPNNVALGHNSVVKKDGEYFVVCHVRAALSGGHHLETRQLYFNEEGWPVMAANRYAGESAGTVEQADVAGEYDLILHTEGRDKTIIKSEKYVFSTDGKVLKGEEEVGGWTLKRNYYIEVTVNNVVYKGVVAPGWKNYGTAKGVLSITATSDAGRSLWANAV